MSYRYDREQQKRTQGFFFGILFVVCVFFTPVISFLYTLLERPLSALFVQSGEIKDSANSILSGFGSKAALDQENKELKERIAILEVDVMRTEYLESVLTAYEGIEAMAISGEEITPAQILARPPQAPADTLIINRGEQHGIVQGNRVVAFDNVLVGYVAEVFTTTSRIHLFSKNTLSMVGILYPSGDAISLEGRGGNYYAEVARETEIEEGSLIYSQESPGRIIAVVRRIVFDPRDPSKHVYLASPINLREVDTLGIVKNPVQ